MKDILGLRELESYKKDLSLAGPGQLTTRCCSTGTCDDKRLPTARVADGNVSHAFLPVKSDIRKIADIKLKYGYLRT